jgi:phosphoglycolate phosphatase
MKTIAFDLDGTLINISKRDYAIYCDILNSLGYIPLQFDRYWPLRKSRYNIFSLLALSDVVDNAHIDFFLKRRGESMEVSEYLMMDSLFADTVSTLYHIKNSYNIALVSTRSNRINAFNQLKQLKLDAIFGSNITFTGKDKLEAYRNVSDLLVIVGDTENDIIAGKQLGVFTIGVTTGIRSDQILSQYSPNRIINALDDLRLIL